ncbi:PIN domain-containing protein [Pararhizobium gei]|uniref:PIN domain-containing protein n=1 Tax=Pararhizobium gei TaxID=1395951 RepID=UPI0023DB5E6A|nr:PIN domain-containing protein [Rhizobium gei]
MRAFFDTNILVYAFSTDPKREQANATIAEGGVISAQVLNELTHVFRRKQKKEWPAIEAALKLMTSRLAEIVPLTAELHAAALPIARDHGLTIYDALIVAAAMEAGCDTLFSEDMQHGRTFDRLTIRNPFLGTSA